ncbi:MAG: endonuclease MutS2 [Bacteroidetes bacterium B1(2017)]|nr:MAG: endonuclease MutS2 [Bacteroidetes bacterium B1(2017)]
MPFPKNIETKLGFNQVRELLQTRCLSAMGISYVERMRFANRHDLLSKMLQQTKEFKTILVEETPFPNEHYFDVGPWLYKAKIEGVWLLEEELHQIKLVVQAFLNVTRFLRERNGKYPELELLLEGLIINDLVVRRIDRILDVEGNLRPNASPELAKISAKIHEKEGEIRKRIQRLFDKNTDLGYLTDAIGITIREGRLVLPVLAEHKRHVPGFVHDESNTGQTVYIEPADCFDLNNMLRELQIAYRRERERILLDITDQIRPEIPELEKNLQRLGLFDFIRAKAILALDMKADLPILVKHPGLKMVKAYHPLLRMSHDKVGQTTIPLSIELNKDKHIVVISGPNAGGKSVCLKTVGLLQYMLQCGLLIPCESYSEVGVYKEIMVDIGDEQSIENDLSTYSSHLLSMKNFCDFADGKTLFLIDEFGTGTDPQFGGPLAEAILHHLAQKKAQGIVTTHFSNLKNFASQYTGLENASMLFDHDKMQPLYQLEIGKPGSSYAFELAGKSGLSQHIINYAKNKVGDKQRKVDDLLVELEKEKKQVNDLRAKFTEREQKAEQLQAKYEKLSEEIEKNKRQFIKQAKQEALALVTEANSKIEATIREIKEQQADSEVQRKARTMVKEQIGTLKKDLDANAKEEEKELEEVVVDLNQTTLVVGDTIRVAGQQTIGQILEIQKNKAVVALGDIRTTVALNKLEKISQKEIKKSVQSAPKGLDMNSKMQHFGGELNIIGTRGEDAVRQLNEYLDEAILLGVKQVRIVHGKGYGILRKLVREQLQANKMIAHFADEHVEMGGDGVTIVTLHT